MKPYHIRATPGAPARCHTGEFQRIGAMRATQRRGYAVRFHCEFAVHPAYRGKGCGHKLHDALLKNRPEPLAHLLVRTDNPAKASYLHWGWHTVSKVQPFEDAPVMDAMIRILPLGGE